MDSALKQRLIGAAVLVALAVIFLPMLLKGPGPDAPDAAQIPLDAPAAPDAEFETRELPLVAPSEVPEGGVTGLGATSPDPADPNAVVTIDQTGAAAPRVDALPEDDGAPLEAIDPAGPAAGGPSGPIDPEDGIAAEAAPTARPTAPLPATTAGGKYAVNVGAFQNLDNARSLADRLRSQGLPLTSESVDVNGKPAMRLRVGPYAERTLAEAARLRVEAVTGSSASVIALDGSAVPPAASARPVAADAAPAVPASAARAGAAPSVGFAVQLGALSSETDANALRDRAKSAGFVAFAQRINTDRGAVWRVRVGPEADRAAADRLRDSVIAKLAIRDAIVVSHP
jgi:DedD protein